MRKTLLVLAAVLGGLLLVVGSAVAVVFGPDDTAQAATSPLPSGVRAATTNPELLGYRNATLRVTAASSAGPVFVGAGNPIDVDSYLGDTRRLRLTTITPLDGATGSVRGETTPPSVEPSSLDFWERSVHGPGAQSLTLELDGTPTSIAAVAAGERGTVTLTFGIVIAHAFVGGVGTALLGLILLSLPVLVRRRRRRRERAAAQSAPCTTEALTVPGPTGCDDVEPVTQAAGSQLRSTHRLRRWAVPVVGVVALTGCAPIPQRVTTVEITRPGLAPDELTAALASYDERNNVAIDLASREHDGTGWAAADRGIILRSDLHQTRYLTEKGEPKVAGRTLTTTPESSSLISPSFTQYPMWFAVAGTMAAPDEQADERAGDENSSEKKADEKKADEKKADDGKDRKGADEKPDADAPNRALLVYERDSVLDPWRMSASVPIGDETVPAHAPGAASRPTAAQVARAQTVSDQIAAYLKSGDAGELTVPDQLAHVREVMVDEGADSRLQRVTVDPVGSGDDATAPGDGAPKVAAVDGGALMTATYSVDCTLTARRSHTTLEFVDEAFARAVGQAGSQTTLHLRFVVAVAAVVPDSGEPTLLGVRKDTVGP